jgi:hypothetical protein
VHHHGAALEAAELDAVEHHALEQARRYADDPAQAEEHLKRWGSSAGD